VQTAFFDKKGALSLALLFLLSGCGYRAGLSLEPHSSEEPALLPRKSLMVPLFFNASAEPLLEKSMTQIFKETLSRRGWSLKEVPAKAELKLSGRITAFGLTPISLSPLGAAREYRIQIDAQIRVLSAKSGTLLQIHPLKGLAEYRVRSSADLDRIAKNRAIREAAQTMADDLNLALGLPRGKSPEEHPK